MIGRFDIYGQTNVVATFLKRDESGAVLVEFALVVSLFFFLFFTLLDFGRLSYNNVLVQKGSQVAARIAVVRPPACNGVPERHDRGMVPNGTLAPRFGTSCSAGAEVCKSIATVSCSGNSGNATASEIWTRITPFMPRDATIASLQFSYSFDPNLGFLGGPFTPMVTVELNIPDFQFISPLGTIAGAAGATNTGSLGGDIKYSSFSVSLPAEDLASGDSG